jgi:hypothetical protein
MPPRRVDTLPGVEPGLAIAGRRHAGTTRGRRCQCCSHRTCSVRQRPLAQAIRACAPRSSSATLTTASPRTQAPGSACPRLGSWTRTTRLAAVGDGCIACLIRESAPRRRRHRLRYCFRTASDCCFGRGTNGRTHRLGRALARSLPPQPRRRAGYAYATHAITPNRPRRRSHSVAAPADARCPHPVVAHADRLATHNPQRIPDPAAHRSR